MLVPQGFMEYGEVGENYELIKKPGSMYYRIKKALPGIITNTVSAKVSI
ncbi:hypothetical protein [Paenibacillus illinoisensis]